MEDTGEKKTSLNRIMKPGEMYKVQSREIDGTVKAAEGTSYTDL